MSDDAAEWRLLEEANAEILRLKEQITSLEAMAGVQMQEVARLQDLAKRDLEMSGYKQNLLDELQAKNLANTLKIDSLLVENSALRGKAIGQGG